MFCCFPFSYNFISNHLGLQSQCLTFIPCVCMQDILHHIYSLLPLRDAARAACSSHAFLRFWRCHPNLTLNWHILCSNANASQENFICIIDNILRNHSGINIKILKLQLYGIYDAYQYLDSWLQVAVKPGIEELTIELCYRLTVGVRPIYCQFCN